MTGNLQAIGFLFTWMLGWGIAGSLIDAGLINAGVNSLEGGQRLTTETLRGVLQTFLGFWRFLSTPQPRSSARAVLVHHQQQQQPADAVQQRGACGLLSHRTGWVIGPL